MEGYFQWQNTTPGADALDPLRAVANQNTGNKGAVSVVITRLPLFIIRYEIPIIGRATAKKRALERGMALVDARIHHRNDRVG